MLSFLLRRSLLALPVMGGVVTLVFLLIHLIPGDPIEVMLGEQALPHDQTALREQLGLNLPLGTQYLHYWQAVLRGELGQSLFSQRSVGSLIAERLGASVELMLGAMTMAVWIAFPLGALAAYQRGRWLDKLSSLFAVSGVAIPNFWLGPLLILLFSITLDWLPVNERGGLEHLILPSITLGTALAALLSRMLRASLADVLSADYIRTARAKGAGGMRILLRHALQNALLPLLTVASLQIGALLSGAIITESIFDWPGIGSLLLQGIRQRDYPVVQGCVLFIALTYVCLNLLTDLLYGWIDPRIQDIS